MTEPSAPPSPDAPGAPGAPDAKAQRAAKLAVTVFPLLIIGGAVAAYVAPGAFDGWSVHVTTALMVIMFGMGLTLTLPDFALVAKRPLVVFAGVAMQYTVMPLLALGIATVLDLPPALAAGLILVGSVPGGTSSNVVTYLARGDVALSVTMTAVSTLLAPLLTPFITLWLAGQYLPVPVGDMAMSIVKIVVIPIAAGLILRALLPRVVDRLLPVLPWISVLGITFVVIAVVSASNAVLTAAGLTLVLAILLHNGLGYAVGYALATLLRYPVSSRRAVSVEVGMQNSGLAAGLATQYFSPEAALPGAFFSVWHNISGGLLASFWGRRPVKDEEREVERVER